MVVAASPAEAAEKVANAVVSLDTAVAVVVDKAVDKVNRVPVLAGGREVRVVGSATSAGAPEETEGGGRKEARALRKAKPRHYRGDQCLNLGRARTVD